MILDIEELLRIFDFFYEQLEIVALPAEAQKEAIKVGVVTDEIALDYCESGMLCAEHLHDNHWITSEQYNMAKMLYNKFDKMSDDKELWNNDALNVAPEWEECRRIARMILSDIS